MTSEERDSIDWKSLEGSDIYFLVKTWDTRTFFKKPLTILRCKMGYKLSNLSQVIKETINPDIPMQSWTDDVYSGYSRFFLTAKDAQKAFDAEQRKYLGKLKRHRSNCERKIKELKLKCLGLESDIEYVNKILEE